MSPRLRRDCPLSARIDRTSDAITLYESLVERDRYVHVVHGDRVSN